MYHNLLQALNMLYGSQNGLAVEVQRASFDYRVPCWTTVHVRKPSLATAKSVECLWYMFWLQRTLLNVCGGSSYRFWLPQSLLKDCSSQTWPPEPLQALNRHCSSQDRHDNPLQTFNYLAGSRNVPGEHLQAFNRFCGSQNKQLQALN